MTTAVQLSRLPLVSAVVTSDAAISFASPSFPIRSATLASFSTP